MTTTARPEATAQVLAIELEEGRDALMRVLMVLHRRCCALESVAFNSGTHSSSGRLIIELVAPPSHAHCVQGWLENIVEVRAVERLESS